MSSREGRYNALLNLSYNNVLISCADNIDSQRICSDPAFWEEKAQRDFGKSLREVPDQYLSAREQYVWLMEGNPSSFSSGISYSTPRSLDEQLIEAAGDKNLFDSLIYQHQKNIYADPNLTFLILIAAIDKENIPLIEAITPSASRVILDLGQRQDILYHAANTGNESLVIYLARYMGSMENINDWIIQAAIVRGDTEYAEALITNYLNLGRYTSLAFIFVRAGDINRFTNLIKLEDLDDREQNASEIFLETVRRNQLEMTQYILENPEFTQYLGPMVVNQGIAIADELGYFEMGTYLREIKFTPTNVAANTAAPIGYYPGMI